MFNKSRTFFPVMIIIIIIEREWFNKDCGRSVIEKGGGAYSYIRIHKPWKQPISKEIDEADLLRSLFNTKYHLRLKRSELTILLNMAAKNQLF